MYLPHAQIYLLSSYIIILVQVATDMIKYNMFTRLQYNALRFLKESLQVSNKIHEIFGKYVPMVKLVLVTNI